MHRQCHREVLHVAAEMRGKKGIGGKPKAGRQNARKRRNGVNKVDSCSFPRQQRASRSSGVSLMMYRSAVRNRLSSSPPVDGTGKVSHGEHE
jgi:hypothetical protein